MHDPDVGGDSAHQVSGCRVQVLRLEEQLAERIVAQTVKAGRDENELGPETLQHSVELALKQVTKVGSGCPRFERHVARRVLTCSFASFAARAGAGIPWVLMKAHEIDGRITVEDVLCPVAVMHIPIDNEDPSEAALLKQPCRDRHVVDETKAHRARGRGVVTRRARQCKAAASIAVQYGGASGHYTADSRAHRIPANR